MDNEEKLRERLAELTARHRDLDQEIARLIGAPPFDQLEIQRLKKQKLALKDMISRVEAMILPDIIA